MNALEREGRTPACANPDAMRSSSVDGDDSDR